MASVQLPVAGEAGDFTKAMTLAGRGGRHLYAYACAKPPLVPTQTLSHVLKLIGQRHAASAAR